MRVLLAVALHAIVQSSVAFRVSPVTKSLSKMGSAFSSLCPMQGVFSPAALNKHYGPYRRRQQRQAVSMELADWNGLKVVSNTLACEGE